MGNSEIQSNEITNEFNSFQFAPGTNTGNIKINWDPGTENNDFMIETTHSNSDKIIFSYEMIYM